jgi:uncharacterized membrane protein
MYGGKTAIASMQYSYLPSALCLIAETGRAEEAGRTLFETVSGYWSTLEPEHRPRLVVFAQSLGTMGATAAFSSVGDLTARTDGALFSGPPYATALWRRIISQRASGSTERLPVYGDGRTVVFAGSAADLTPAQRSPQPPRVVFLQHASDPVVWWSPDLVLRQPDWLQESHGQDVIAAMHWYPVVTFWQVTGDLLISVDPPAGHGHHYGPEVPVAWAAILHPPGWTDSQTVVLSAQESG